MSAITGIGHTIIVFGFTHQYLVYGLITLIGIIEGPVISLLLGLLLKIGYFNFIPVYASLMVGDLIGDTFWYWTGYHYGRKVVLRIGKWFKFTEEDIKKAERLFHRHDYKILFLSKVSNGLGFAIPVLITAGVSKIPFGKFISTNAAGQFVWTGLLLALGYFFGSLYGIIPSLLGKISIVALVLIVTMILIFYIKRRRVTV